MTTLSGRLLRAALVVLAVLALAPATAAADAGKVNFAKPAESSFDVFTKAPTATLAGWMRDRYWRMRAYAPYFDSRLSWFPNGWAYHNAYAIYRGKESGLEQYILKDANGNRLYIPFACSAGSCTQYAADIGDPGWRARFIAIAKERAASGYKGIFVDDVNLAFKVGDGHGNFVAPIDRRTGTTMTLAAWQRYFAEFMEQLRAALPAGFEIVHNQVYFHAGLSNAYVRRAIEAATHIEIERGVIDTGIVGGTGTYGYETVLAWAEHIHSRGKGVVWDAQSTWGREYQLATYFLLSNGLDGLAHPDGSDPNNWWSGYDVDLGRPLGARYSSDGVFRRDFQHGTVLVNQPGQTTRTITLDSPHRTLAGTTTSSVTLAARDGAVLLDPAPAIGRAAAAEDGSGGTPPHPAKLEIARARLAQSTRRLSILAPITRRASGTVSVAFHAAGHVERFRAAVRSGKAAVRIDRRVSQAQARRGTGIVTLAYKGSDRTQPQEVRLRAAPRAARLRAARPRIAQGRLTAAGTISTRARGVVRLQLLYEPSGARTRTLRFTAKIRNGRYRFSEKLSAEVLREIEQRRGVVHSYTLFTGHLASGLQGEMRSFQVRGAR